MHEYTVKVFPGQEGMRLDLFLTEFSNTNNLGLSRTFIQRLILKDKVTLGDLKLTKSHYKVKASDEFRISIEDKEPDTLKPQNLPLAIVYEDEDLAIINKDSGLVVHPGAGNYEHTLVNALLYHFKNLSDVNPHRPGIVHRLDKETSGLLVIAKNNFSHLTLAEQFARHSIERKYIAIVEGKMEFDENVIELPIGRHPVKRKNMAVGFRKTARYAKTYYRTLKRTANFSLLELKPFTGRTHQLRVHLAFLGHPILGDNKYGKSQKNKEFTPLQAIGRHRKDSMPVTAFKRLALHAQSIGLKHPRTGKFISFTSDMPKEFREFFPASSYYEDDAGSRLET